MNHSKPVLWTVFGLFGWAFVAPTPSHAGQADVVGVEAHKKRHDVRGGIVNNSPSSAPSGPITCHASACGTVTENRYVASLVLLASTPAIHVAPDHLLSPTLPSILAIASYQHLAMALNRSRGSLEVEIFCNYSLRNRYLTKYFLFNV